MRKMIIENKVRLVGWLAGVMVGLVVIVLVILHGAICWMPLLVHNRCAIIRIIFRRHFAWMIVSTFAPPPTHTNTQPFFPFLFWNIKMKMKIKFYALKMGIRELFFACALYVLTRNLYLGRRNQQKATHSRFSLWANDNSMIQCVPT